MDGDVDAMSKRRNPTQSSSNNANLENQEQRREAQIATQIATRSFCNPNSKLERCSVSASKVIRLEAGRASLYSVWTN